MGRTNHSYNGMLSAIARKPLPRFTNYAKDAASLSTIFGNEYSTINKRGNDSLTNIISADFNTPEEYIKETNVGPIITLNGDRTVTMIAGETYTDLGATADGGETVTVDTSNLDSNAVGTYTVSYSATDTAGYTRVENRFVKVTRGLDGDGISSWDLKSTLSDLFGLNNGFAYRSASISGDGAWISIGSAMDGYGNVYMYSKNADTTYSKTQVIIPTTAGQTRFGVKTKISRNGDYLCVGKDNIFSNYSGFQMFKRTNNTWNSIGDFIQFDHRLNGLSISNDGTYIAIGTNQDVDQVKVYIKSADDASITLMEEISPPDDLHSAISSISISDNGELLCFGTPSVNSNTGNVYVYTRTTSSWSTNPTAVIEAPELGDVFGRFMSMSGDGNFIAIPVLRRGEVYIYKRSGSSWSLSSMINGPSGYDVFGISVALSQNADYLVVGTLNFSGPTGDRSFIYSRDSDDSWILKQTISGDTGSGLNDDVHISSAGNYVLVTTVSARANAYVFYGAGYDGLWVPGYTTVPVTLGDKLQPSVSSLTRGQKYVFDFSQTRGKDFSLSLDGTTKFTYGVIEAESTLVYSVPSILPSNKLYYYSPNTPGIGGSFSVPGTLDDGVIYFDGDGNLRATNITTLIRGQESTFNFSSDYGTKIALSTSLNGTDLTEGITSTDTTLAVTLPLYYPYSTIFLKSLDTSNIGSPLSVLGTLNDGVIYFDGDGNLRATNITTLIRGQESTFNFSSDYGNRVLLALTEDGDTFEEGVTSNLTTELVFTIPGTYGKNIIYVKSPTTSGIGSPLSVTGDVTPNHVYFDAGGTLQVSGLTTLTRGQESTFYFSSDYGTRVLLALTEDGDTFEEGVTSNLTTELVFTIPGTYGKNIIYVKSPTTSGIGSPLSIIGDVTPNHVYVNADGTLQVSGLTTLTRGQESTFYFSSDYGTSVALSNLLNGTDLTEGISNTETSLTVTLPFTYPYSTIFLKSLDTLNIGSEISVNGLLETKLLAGNPAANENFGRSASISGDGLTAIVGAHGSAYIFNYANGGWSQTAKLLAGDSAADDYFGHSVSISNDGLTAIVGAIWDDGVNDNYSNSGSAYIFKYANGGWSQTAKLLAGDPAADDNFGYSVSISDDGLTAIVGAIWDDGVNNNFNGSGSAYIFKYANGGWSQTAKLLAGDPAANDYFGFSASISGDGLTAIVGAIWEDGVNNNFIESGSAYIFKYANGGWSQTAKLLAGDPAANDYFGWAVSISNDGLTAIVGAVGDDGVNDNYSSSGSAYIFKYANGGWSQTAKLLAGDPAADVNFGFSASISNDGLTAIVGAYGSVYIFNYL